MNTVSGLLFWLVTIVTSCTHGPAMPKAGWLDRARVARGDVASTIRAAPVIAIVRVVATGNSCMNSIHESLIGEVLEVARGGSVPHRVFAHDDSMGFPHGDRLRIDGQLLVAALSPKSPQRTMQLVDE